MNSIFKLDAILLFVILSGIIVKHFPYGFRMYGYQLYYFMRGKKRTYPNSIDDETPEYTRVKRSRKVMIIPHSYLQAYLTKYQFNLEIMYSFGSETKSISHVITFNEDEINSPENQPK